MARQINWKFSLTFLLWTLSLLVSSCGKEEFKTNPNKENPPLGTKPVTASSQLCSDFTPVKPPVDFLFLWDNSASQYFVTPEAKLALNNTINLISKRFDYRVLMAPLLVEDYSLAKVNDEVHLIAENLSGISQSMQAKVKAQSEAIHLLNFTPRGGSRERGLSRAYNLLSQNIGTGVFRKNAYTIIVLMSNGNENSYIPEGHADNGGATYFTQLKANYLHLRDTNLQALQMRFISVVAHSACVNGFKQGYHYTNMSRELYATAYPNGKPSPIDQAENLTPDSYDICSNSFSRVFEGINASIEPQIIKHVYNYWPITTDTAARIDLGNMQVIKIIGSSIVSSIPQDALNGWQFVGNQTNRNTRVQPFPGEPFSGQMIKLNGSAQVAYPECLKIKTKTPVDYYGFIHLHSKPVLNTINLKVDNFPIPQSTVNGWQYIGQVNNQNIKIVHPTNPVPDTNYPDFKTGYFLKIRGKENLEKLVNGASIDLIYTPAAN